VALLPGERRDWGTAMRAELAGIGPAAERRSFAAGCVRAAFSQPPVWRSVTSTGLLVATAVAGLVLAGGLATVAIQLEMCALIVAIVGFASAGRHFAAFGPVAPGRTARTVRTCAYVFLGFALISSLVEERRFPGNEHGMTIAFIFVIALFLAFQGTMLAATARGSRMPAGALAIGTGTGAVGGVGWFGVRMVRPTFGTTVSVPLLVAMASAVAAVAFSATPAASGPTGSRRRNPGLLGSVGTAVAAGLAAAGSALMLISFLASAAMVAVTSKVPDIVGPVMVPGSTAAQKLREDMIEVGDTYFGVLVFGGLAFAALGILISASRLLGRRTRGVEPAPIPAGRRLTVRKSRTVGVAGGDGGLDPA
jgi:hypothetical protein